jgi:hypothetical protein
MNDKYDSMSGLFSHHLGLIVIGLAFLSLLYQNVINGKKIYLPGHFFLLYGLGEIFLVYSSYDLLNSNLTVSMIEGMLGLISLYIYFH